MTSKPGVDLLVTGAGSLATATLHALSACPGPVSTIAVAARDPARTEWLARSAQGRATALGHGLQLLPLRIDWEDSLSLRSLLARTRPRVILHTASVQSPWTLAGSDRWSRLVQDVGYGLTLPLHLLLARRLGCVAASEVPETVLVNACYPDAVNPMLSAVGIPVAGGIGNIAILATLLRAELPQATPPLRLIAHHAHVSFAISGRTVSPSPLGWAGERRIDGQIVKWLQQARLPSDERLNAVTAAAAVPMLHAFVSELATYVGHAPGVGGRAGGYPIVVRNRRAQMDLPPGLNEVDARVHNERAAASDGVVVNSDGLARWTDRVHSRLAIAGDCIPSRLARTFSADDTEELAAALLEVRSATQCREA